jgi:AmmeMemoRadiSam system protein B
MRDVQTRKAAVAGSWYPGSSAALAAQVDAYLRAVPAMQAWTHVTAIIVPHAGLMYSGAVAAHGFSQLAERLVDVAVLVGPAHAGGFDGVALWPSGGFESPFGVASIDDGCAERLLAATPTVAVLRGPHLREHSLEMQLPFLQRVAADARIVPLVMGWQTAETAMALGQALAAAVAGSRAVLVASTDLSHYHDAATAARLDASVIDCVARFDAEGLQTLLDGNPHHACGGGPTVAVMRAAWALGARDAAILAYADSGDVSGDKSSVVGYLAAVLGTR